MVHEPVGLSNEALRFLRESPVVLGESESDVILDTSELPLGSVDLARMRQFVAGFRRDYEGRSFVVAGGMLEGSIVLGCGSNPLLRKSCDGVTMFRAARHEYVQCDIVISEHGTFGCSWGNEFHPLFNSVASFIEDCAIWNKLHGWYYVCSLEGGFDRVLDVLGETTSRSIEIGEFAAWCLGGDIAIATHPFLNPGRNADAQIDVMVRSKEKIFETLEYLRKNGIWISGDLRRIVDVMGRHPIGDRGRV